MNLPTSDGIIDVVVVGAGFLGVYAVYRYRRQVCGFCVSRPPMTSAASGIKTAIPERAAMCVA